MNGQIAKQPRLGLHVVAAPDYDGETYSVDGDGGGDGSDGDVEIRVATDKLPDSVPGIESGWLLCSSFTFLPSSFLVLFLLVTTFGKHDRQSWLHKVQAAAPHSYQMCLSLPVWWCCTLFVDMHGAAGGAASKLEGALCLLVCT